MFLMKKENKKNKICKKGSLPESADILSHQAEACRCQETPPCPWLEGSFTLEAAVILPLMALFFVMILMFFRVMQVQMEVQRALDDTGRRLSVFAAQESADDSAMIGMAAANVLFLTALKYRCGCPESHRLESGSMQYAVNGSGGQEMTVIRKYGCM